MRVLRTIGLATLCLSLGCIADTGTLEPVPRLAPALLVSSLVLEFDATPIGESDQRELVLTNVGNLPLIISQLFIDAVGQGSFRTESLQTQLAPGESETVLVTFTPFQTGLAEGSLIILSNDPDKPETEISMFGETIGPRECRIAVEPNLIDFGQVRSDRTAEEVLDIQNIGTGECVYTDFRIEGSDAFSFAMSPAPVVVRPPGERQAVAIRYAPQNELDEAVLQFETNDPQNPVVTIPLRGVTEFIVPLECSADQSTSASVPVRLLATSPLPIASWRWDIVRAPPGGIGTPEQWTPNPPEQANVQFIGFILGDYRIRARATDDLGRTGECFTNVQVRGNGLQITLTWDGTGDIDLHLHNDAPTSWFSGEDCYYQNQTPIWDSASPATEGANPELDFDNTQRDGPENTRIESVELGRSYVVGVHNFARGAGRTATVEIFCGQDVEPDLVIDSRIFEGVASGNCSSNEFWKVASVVFTNQSTCNITVLDNYVTAEDACERR